MDNFLKHFTNSFQGYYFLIDHKLSRIKSKNCYQFKVRGGAVRTEAADEGVFLRIDGIHFFSKVDKFDDVLSCLTNKLMINLKNSALFIGRIKLEVDLIKQNAFF